MRDGCVLLFAGIVISLGYLVYCLIERRPITQQPDGCMFTYQDWDEDNGLYTAAELLPG